MNAQPSARPVPPEQYAGEWVVSSMLLDRAEKFPGVVAVRAEGGANVPVLYLGREIARTDGSGAAHVAFRVASTDAVTLTLDTTEQPKLRPQHPSMSFHGAERDQLTAFAQKFEAEAAKPKPRVAPHAAPEPMGPVRLDRHHLR